MWSAFQNDVKNIETIHNYWSDHENICTDQKKLGKYWLNWWLINFIIFIFLETLKLKEQRFGRGWLKSRRRENLKNQYET